MISLFENKRVFLLFAAFVVVSLMLIIWVLSLFSSKPQSQKEPAPTITLFPKSSAHPDLEQYSDTYKQESKEVNKQEQEVLQQDSLVFNFINTLPYQGQYMSIFYTISTNEVTLILQKNNQARGNQEFDELLKKNNIPIRPWIKDLVVKIQ